MGIYKSGQNWGIDYYDGCKRKRLLIGPSKGEAKKHLAAKKSEPMRSQEEARPRIESPPFDQFTQRYAEFSKTSKRGFYNERYRLEQLTKHFGPRKLADITRWDADNLKIELSHSVAPATINRLLGNLKHMLTMAVEWKNLSNNPLVGLKLLRVPKRADRILRTDEEQSLLAACERVHTPHLRSSVMIALNTGMRKGEIFGLRWENVDFSNRFIRIVEGKTEQSERCIPMNDAVFELLSQLQNGQKNDFVFPSTRKTGERFRDPKKGFLKAIRLAQIPHLRFHDLRHTFATRLVRAGVDLITVQHLMGHSTIAMTSRYAHSLADDKMAAVKRLDFAGVR